MNWKHKQSHIYLFDRMPLPFKTACSWLMGAIYLTHVFSSTQANLVSCVALLILAFFSKTYLLFLIITWSLYNNYWPPLMEPGIFWFTTIVVLLGVLYRIVLLENNLTLSRNLLIMIICIIPTIFTSKLPLVSLLKLGSWATVVIIFFHCAINDRDSYRAQLLFALYIYSILVVAGITRLWIFNVGVEAGDNLYDGFFKASPLSGLIHGSIFIFGIHMLSKNLDNPKAILFTSIALCAATGLILSNSTTAIVGVGLASISIPAVYLVRKIGIYTCSAISLLLIPLTFVPISNDSSIFTEYFESRITLISKSIDALHSNIFLGMGFGIPYDYENYDNQFTLSAPTEKIFPYAVLDEHGIFVGFVILFLIAKILIRSVKRGDISFWIPIGIYASSVNLGEFMMFSIGGGLFWIALFLAMYASSYSYSRKL